MFGWYTVYTFSAALAPNGISRGAKFTLRPSLAFSYCILAALLRGTALPIEVPLGLWARIRRKHHVLHGGPYPPWEGPILVDRGAYCKV